MTEALTYKDLQYFTEHECLVCKTPEGNLVALRPPEGLQGEVIILDQAPAYGEISTEDNAVATTVGSALVWYQVDKFDTNGESSLFTPEHANNHIIVGRSGLYLALISASILRAGGAACIVECELKKNNGVTSFPNVHWDRRLGSNDVGSTSASGLVRLTEGDTAEVWFQNKTNTTDITFEDITLAITQVGRV